MSSHSIPPGRQLPSKESALFKQILRLYENKQYKKALRTAEQILKKFPEHGETLAMKGLVYSFIDKKDESYDLVKRALKLDLTSHICWHVLGLLHRADKNYEEAIKCYINALRNDKENLQLMRDLSVLYIQLRNFEGFKDTRQQLLNVRPQQKLSWIGLGLGYHLMGNYDFALKILNAFDASQGEKDPNTYDFEQSEFLLYRNRILIDAERYAEALEDLNKISPFVFDGVAVRETRAFLLHKLGKSECSNHYRNLIAENSENTNYYLQLIEVLKIEDDEGKLKLFDEISSAHPKAHSPKRLALNVSHGEEFDKRMEEYLVSWFRKGAPSLFVSIKPLLRDEAKAKSIETISMRLYQRLKETKKIYDDKLEEPTTYLWLLYFLSKLLDHKRESSKALEFINQAIEHTPTVVELLQQKAKIFKHAGNLQEAKNFINQARELDLQDRCINTKCTKYMIRADSLQEAENTITLFTKADSSDPPQDLIDMQCMWYAIECGSSHARKGDFGKALKRFHQIEKHFIDIAEDQFDFHSYCIRRVTLRAYVDFLKYEDRVRGHKFYLEAAVRAIQCYLDLHDKKDRKKELDPSLDSLSEEEKRKALNKLKKAEAKAKEKETVSKNDKNKKPRVVDDDPDGEKYLSSNYIEEAVKFLKPLTLLLPKRIETHLSAIKVYLRKGKYLLALKSLLKAREIDRNNGELHFLTIELIRTAQSTNEVVQKIISEEIGTILLGEKDAASFNNKYLQESPKCASRTLYVAKGCLSLELKQESENLVSNVDSSFSNLTLDIAILIHEFTGKELSNETIAKDLYNKLGSVFTFSTYFHPELLKQEKKGEVEIEHQEKN